MLLRGSDELPGVIAGIRRGFPTSFAETSVGY